MKLLAQIPEQPIKEDWLWLTDVMTSDNAKEQRVCNSELPKRIHNVSLKFDNIDDLTSHFTGMVLGAKEAFQVPLYQYGTRLKASAGAGTTTLSIISANTELRAGADCLVYDSDGYELHTIQDMDSTSVTLTVGLARVFGLRASICPVSTVTTTPNAALTLGILDHDAKATLVLNETGFINPFLNPYNSSALTMVNGLPVLTARPTGSDFPVQFDTGMKVSDEGGVVQVRSPWAYSRLILPRSFICERVFTRSDYEQWFLFANTVKGSWKPFYMPSYRADFALAAAPVPGGASLTFAGATYHDSFFQFEAFKGVAIFHATGTHYAHVTACALAGTDSQVTFDPPLPADAGAVDRVTLLLKVRIADDKISWQHFSLYSQVDLTVRTIEA